jgi:hypothetical protein
MVVSFQLLHKGDSQSLDLEGTGTVNGVFPADLIPDFGSVNLRRVTVKGILNLSKKLRR